MPSYHRIVWLHYQLHEMKYPNASSIAKAFEISNRQAQRDVEYLRDSLKAPLKYSYEKKGYFYIYNFTLPTFFLTVEEMENLKRLSAHYNKMSMYGYKNYAEYAYLLLKLTGEDDVTKPLRPIAPYKAEIKVLDNKYRYSELEHFKVASLDTDIYVYEFFNPEVFISLLISSDMKFKIQKPRWLRERLVEKLNYIIENHKAL